MFGYILAMLVGLSLGLLGGGGSIITVPILVYVMKLDAKLSIALSLGIVGLTSLIGVWGHTRKQNVDYKVAVLFGPIAMLGTFVGAKLSRYLTGEMQLIIFSVIMLLAAIFMLRNKKTEQRTKAKLNIPLLLGQGVVVGIITGLVGIGGGFLIVPALVLLAGLSMKRAVGTSLLIITLNSFAGFAGYWGMVEIPWKFMFGFSFFSMVGILLGTYLVKFVSQQALKKGFAVFLILMGAFILFKNSH